MNGGGRLTRALHTLTKRMLDAQTAWEEKKNAIEASRADDFSNVLTSLNSVLAAAQGRAPPSTGTTKPLPRTEFLNRGSSVINRQLAQKNPILFPAPPPPGQPGPVGGNIAAGGSSSNQPTPRQAASGTAGQQPTNLGLITSGISSKASLASNDDKRPQPPPARKGVRATGGRTGAHVRSGAGEMAVGFFATQPPPNGQQPAGQPPVGGRVTLRPDLVSEVARFEEGASEIGPYLAVSKMATAGHEHLLLPGGPQQGGAEFRKKFGQ